MSREFDRVLDECLTWLHAGASVEACLARYPDYAEDLRPLLELAADVQAVPLPRPSAAAVQANRQRLLNAVREKEARRPLISILWGLLALPWGRVAVAAAVIFLVLGLGWGGLTTAADSLPGDTLYPVKRLVENVRFALTTDPVARQQLQVEFARERRDEIWALLGSGREATVEFRGLLEEIGEEHWIIGGLRLDLDDQTVIIGQPAVGAVVRVEAWLPGDGTLLARRLEVQSAPMPTASPSAVPSLMATANATPTLPSHTPSATLTLTSTPAPSASSTSTPWPSYTPSPGPSASATFTPQPTDTPQPTETPESGASVTPGATATHEPGPTHAPQPTETHEPEPTRAPQPTETHEPGPTHTAMPTVTHEPKPTATEEFESTDEPEPTETEEGPKATHTPHPTGTKEPEATYTPHPTRRP